MKSARGKIVDPPPIPAGEALFPSLLGRQVEVRRFMPALTLLVLVIVAFYPAFDGAYIWDDNTYLTANELLRPETPHGFVRIWTDPMASQDYQPLVFTTLWVEYRLWGLGWADQLGNLHAVGYHITNALLHGLGAILLWRVLRRLDVSTAWIAAAIWAVHPMQVESVAWIAERKNVLSGAFFFASVLCYLRFAGIGTGAAGARRWWWYAGSLVLFAAAMLSKIVTCGLPLVVLALLWWRRRRIRWSEAWPIMAMIPLALGLGAMQVWLQRYRVGASGPEFAFTPVERVLIAGRSLGFYVWKTFLPQPLMPIYPRFVIDVHQGWQYLFPAAAAGAVAGLWLMRGRIGRGPVVALVCYGVLVGPALGFINFWTMLYTFVADRYQYLALAALVPVVTEVARYGLARFWGKNVRATQIVGGALAGAAMLGCVALTWSYDILYRSEIGLWDYNARVNPGNFEVQVNLGSAYESQGAKLAALQPKAAGAIDQLAVQAYQRAIELKPSDETAYDRLAMRAYRRGDPEGLRAAFKALEANVPLPTGPATASPRFSEDIRRLGGDGDYFLGRLYMDRKDYRTALGYFETNLGHFPHHAYAWQAAGMCHESLGENEQARECYKQAIANDPSLAAGRH